MNRRDWHHRMLAVVGLLLVPMFASAEETPVATASEDEELTELLAILDEETEIATKTRMNSDFVPGIVTVLEGRELEALGVETVWEALRLVPGIEPVLNNLGNPSMVVRGIAFPFNSGNVKILVDSIPLTRESAGITGGVLYMPTEQVERVEVIRGPGSVVYGDFAFMGLVNIITRKQGHRLHMRGDSEERWSGSARLGARPDSPFQWSMAVTEWTSSSGIVPEDATGDEDRRFGLASLAYEGLSASAQYVERRLEGQTGAGVTPPSFEQETWAVEARYERELGRSLRATLRLSRLHDELIGRPSAFEDGFTRVGADLHWTGWGRHSFLLAGEYASLAIERAAHDTSDAPAPEGGQRPPSTEILDVSRNVTGLTLQDRFDVTDAFSATAGLRWDDYNDIGSRVTPRLALVWRVSEHHILKAQYAEGFRAPTFFEQYRGGSLNTELGFEINRTAELNYVLRRPNMTGRATVFRSDIHDMVFGIPDTPRFGNTREARAAGFELEWTQQLTSRVKGIVSFSWVDTEDNRGRGLSVHEGTAAPDWMGNLAVLARPFTHTVLALHCTHVGQRPTEGAAAYNLVDLTLTQTELWLPGLHLRTGIKNVLDDPVTYVPGAGPFPTLEYGGRTLWAQLSWRN